MIWIVFALMTAGVLALLLVPLLRGGRPTPARAAYDLAVYKDQLAELDRDLERGVLTEDQAGAARLEIQRRLLAVAEGAKGALAAGKAARRPLTLAAVIAVGVPALSFAIYSQLGSPNLPDQPYAARAAQIRTEKAQAQRFQGMVDRLAARLQTQPKDGRGWAMLGRSYAVLGQPDKAADAYEKALPLLPDDLQVRMEYASLLYNEMPDGSALPPRLVAVLRQVLALDAGNEKALYLVGEAEAQAGHFDKARALWTSLAAKLPAGSPERAEVEGQLKKLK